MKFETVYFINGTAYAGKSTMVKLLAEKYDGIACEENYQDRLLENLDTKEFPNLTYTRDLQDWGEFVRRTPDEYEAWVNGVRKNPQRRLMGSLQPLWLLTVQSGMKAVM